MSLSGWCILICVEENVAVTQITLTKAAQAANEQYLHVSALSSVHMASSKVLGQPLTVSVGGKTEDVILQFLSSEPPDVGFLMHHPLSRQV